MAEWHGVDADRLRRLVAALRDDLSPRQREVLRLMREAELRDDWDDACIVKDGRSAYVGLESIAARTIYALVRAMAIKTIEGDADGYEVFGLTEEGRDLAVPEPETGEG